MTILHVTHEMSRASGVATFVRELARASAFASETLAETRGDPLPEKIRADVVHVHGLWRPCFHRIARQALAQGVPVVWSPHGMLAPWSMRHKRLKKLIAWLLYQKADLGRAAVIHVTSGQEADWVRGLGFRLPLVRAPLGTHLPTTFSPPSAGAARRTLLAVGRVHPVKALDRLILAFGKVAGEGTSESIVDGATWRLRIVGPDEGGHMAELMALCEKAGLSYADPDGTVHLPSAALAADGSTRPRVTFAGPRFGDALSAEYAACDALALVSHTENFGATVVDALAHGKPVVTSTRTPWREVAERGCGLWVENDVGTLAAALRGLFGKIARGEGEEMGRRARALAESGYAWPAVARTLDECYRRFVK